MHDSACEAASKKPHGRTFTTKQVALVVSGCCLAALLLGAAAAVAGQRYVDEAGAYVMGYRQLRDSLDPAPPPVSVRLASMATCL